VGSCQRHAERKAPQSASSVHDFKLQQAAYNRSALHRAKRTMSLAQKLYEGVRLGEEGSVALITPCAPIPLSRRMLARKCGK
jgi:DNA topoisomerase IA